jgi:hypothetical protein
LPLGVLALKASENDGRKGPEVILTVMDKFISIGLQQKNATHKLKLTLYGPCELKRSTTVLNQLSHKLEDGVDNKPYHVVELTFIPALAILVQLLQEFNEATVQNIFIIGISGVAKEDDVSGNV